MRRDGELRRRFETVSECLAAGFEEGVLGSARVAGAEERSFRGVLTEHRGAVGEGKAVGNRRWNWRLRQVEELRC